ncbi:MAG: histidinol-phosphate transaminase [Thermoplasmata archaeon]|nr:histidinol-phosphate transaminase [Thermoplasmata archaeon]
MDRNSMRASVRGLEMYYNPVIAPGTLRMDTNTNVLGSNPAAAEYLRNLRVDLNGYPNTYSNGLREELARLYDLEMENLVAGNGSDEMLNTIYTTFAEPGKTVCTYPCPSYSLYPYFIDLASGIRREVDLTEDFQLDVDAIVGKGEENKGIIIMPTPNNPTGNCFRQKDIEEVLAKHEGIVILDEAYAEYARTTMMPKVEEFDNLIVVKTFSKAYAMANMRVGYMGANRKVADMLNAVKVPYSLNSVSEGAAIAAARDQDFVKRSVDMVSEQRPKLMAKLRELGFKPYPSDSNFILAESPIDHARLIEGLKERKVLIRDFGHKRRTENCVRPTVGTEELNRIMTDAIEDVLAGEKR